MVTGFYAALAGAASVFIGILTALLASNLSNLNAQRERINRRIDAIDARIRSLDDRHQDIQSEIDEIKKISSLRRLRKRWKEYGTDPRPPTEPVPPLQYMSPADDEEKRELENWQRLKRRLISNHQQEDRDVIAEIEALQQERRNLDDRFKSLDPARIRRSLWSTVITIVLSVGVPLFAYLLRVTEVTVVTNVQPWIVQRVYSSYGSVDSFLYSTISENSLTKTAENYPTSPRFLLTMRMYDNPGTATRGPIAAL